MRIILCIFGLLYSLTEIMQPKDLMQCLASRLMNELLLLVFFFFFYTLLAKHLWVLKGSLRTCDWNHFGPGGGDLGREVSGLQVLLEPLVVETFGALLWLVSSL